MIKQSKVYGYARIYLMLQIRKYEMLLHDTIAHEDEIDAIRKLIKQYEDDLKAIDARDIERNA